MTNPIPDLHATVCRIFDDDVLPSLSEFVKIKNLSPAFDPHRKNDSESHAALQHISDWAKDNAPANTQIRKLTRVENAPMLIIDIPGTANGAVMCFGHLDKYPPAEGWEEGLSAYEPVLRDDKLFGRGAVSGGFSPYCYIAAIASLAELELPFPRCVIALEMSYESHGIYLPKYFPDIRAICDEPDLIISLDAICADYERIWYLTGYRGLIVGHLTVQILDKAAHSGAAGLAPSALGIAFDLLGRICNLSSGLMTLDSFAVARPKHLTSGGSETDAIAGRYFLESAGLTKNVPGITDNFEAAAMLPIWNSSLNIAGIEGLASSSLAGGSLPSEVTLKISVRTPPSLDSFSVVDHLEEALVDNPPFSASIDYSPSNILPGWYQKTLPDWLKSSVDTASVKCFGETAINWSNGGAYPEIEILAQEFADVPILMTGVMGPESNFHVANESLYLPAARNMTAAIAKILTELTQAR